MPKIYEYFGFVFFFYANDHEPIHVHVQTGEYESKIEFEMQNAEIVSFSFKTIKGKTPIPESKQKDARTFIENYGDKIVKKWIDFYVLKKEIRSQKITKKLS